MPRYRLLVCVLLCLSSLAHAAAPEGALAYVRFNRPVATLSGAGEWAATMTGFPLLAGAEFALRESMLEGVRLASADLSYPFAVLMYPPEVGGGGPVAAGFFTVYSEAAFLADFVDPRTNELLLVEEDGMLIYEEPDGTMVFMRVEDNVVLAAESPQALGLLLASRAWVGEGLAGSRRGGDVELRVLPRGVRWLRELAQVSLAEGSEEERLAGSEDALSATSEAILSEMLADAFAQLHEATCSVILQDLDLALTLDIAPGARSGLAGWVADNPGGGLDAFAGAVPPDSFNIALVDFNLPALIPPLDYLESRLVRMLQEGEVRDSDKTREDLGELTTVLRSGLAAFTGRMMFSARVLDATDRGIRGVSTGCVVGVRDASPAMSLLDANPAWPFFLLDAGLFLEGWIDGVEKGREGPLRTYSARLAAPSDAESLAVAVVEGMYGKTAAAYVLPASGALIVSDDRRAPATLAANLHRKMSGPIHPELTTLPDRTWLVVCTHLPGLLSAFHRTASAVRIPKGAKDADFYEYAAALPEVSGETPGVLQVLGARDGRIVYGLVVPGQDLLAVKQAILAVVFQNLLGVKRTSE